MSSAASWPERSVERFCLSIGVWLVAWCAHYLVVTGFLRALGVDALESALVLAIMLAAVTVHWCMRLSPRTLLASFLCAVLLCLAATVMASLWRDISYDGQAIHLPSALEISSGLNPVMARPGMHFSAVYPNGLWTLQALFLQLSPALESGKAPAWILTMASVPLMAQGLRTLRGAWGPVVPVALAMVLANPVLLLQLTSFELDGVVYSLVVIAVAGAMLLTTGHHRTGLVVLLGACLLLINTKITGLYWAGVIVVAALIQQWALERRLPVRLALVLMTSLTVSFVLVGWRPYVTVPLETGQWLGASTDVVLGPSNLKEAGPLHRLGYLIFGEGGNPVGAEEAQLKWPWQMPAHEFVSLLDIRIGGFGPGFGLQVTSSVLAAVVMLVAHRQKAFWRDSRQWLAPFWVGVLTVATVFFPVSWWARLVAPFWLATVLLLVWHPAGAGFARRTGRVLHTVGWLLALVGLCVTSVGTAFTLRNIHLTNQAMTQVLGHVATQGYPVRVVPLTPPEQDQTAYVWMQRLMDASIYPHIGDKTGCGQALFSTGSVFLCLETGVGGR